MKQALSAGYVRDVIESMEKFANEQRSPEERSLKHTPSEFIELYVQRTRSQLVCHLQFPHHVTCMTVDEYIVLMHNLLRSLEAEERRMTQAGAGKETHMQKQGWTRQEPELSVHHPPEEPEFPPLPADWDKPESHFHKSMRRLWEMFRNFWRHR